ncbi:MAG: hypothetical protein EAZ27_13500 [Cytophagales bacterium]|nr:MAG: hypothetical protein EAZ27_13500 [Cytophagales bacterium]
MPENNGNERTIRNTKVKTKLFGLFKSLENAQIFAILRSVVHTLFKNNEPILPNLKIIGKSRAE